MSVKIHSICKQCLLLFSLFLLASCKNPFFIDAVKLYEVTFETNGGSEINPVRTDFIEKAPHTEKEDCSLEGWYTTASFSGEAVTFPFEPSKDTKLYAKWKQTVFTATFVTNCDTEIATYKTDAIQTAPALSKADYTFVGWFTTADFKETPVIFPYTLTENTTLYAKWAQSVFTVNFETNCDDEVASYKTDTIETAPTISKTDYVLVGWYTTADFSDTPITFPYTLTADTTLYAKWAQNVFKATFVTNCDTEIVSYKTDTIKKSPDVVKDDYTLVGWFTSSDFEGTPIIFPYTLTADTTLYAKWAQTVFTVTFVTNCEKTLASYKTDKITTSPTVERENYALVGWYTAEDCSGSQATFPLTLTKDITLYAKWQQTAFLVTFETNGGSEIAAYTTSQIQSSPTTTRENYVFNGWYTDSEFNGNAISYPFVVTMETTLHAKWLKQCTVSFVTEYGEVPASIIKTENDILSAEELPALAIDGYLFKGWYAGETEIVAGNYVVTDDVTLTAVWKEYTPIDDMTQEVSISGSLSSSDDYVIYAFEAEATTCYTINWTSDKPIEVSAGTTLSVPSSCFISTTESGQVFELTESETVYIKIISSDVSLSSCSFTLSVSGNSIISLEQMVRTTVYGSLSTAKSYVIYSFYAQANMKYVVNHESQGDIRVSAGLDSSCPIDCFINEHEGIICLDEDNTVYIRILPPQYNISEGLGSFSLIIWSSSTVTISTYKNYQGSIYY